MRRFGLLLKRLARETRAATAVEYGLIVAMIVLAMLGGFKAVGTQTITMWNNVSSAVTGTH